MDILSLAKAKQYADKLKTEADTQRQQDILKVTAIDKELNDFQKTLSMVNVNQEAKQSVTGHGTVSLPKNAANGQVSSVVKGRTLKNELNYNKDTWAEWTKVNAIGDGTGLELTSATTTFSTARLSTSLKVSTKYGVLYNVVNSNLNGTFYIDGNNMLTPAAPVLSKTIGNQKIVITTVTTVTANRILLAVSPGTAGEKIKIRDIRVFELPTGSEIEADFTNMTADQLAQKYPYIQGGAAKSTISAGRLTSITSNNIFNKNNIRLKPYYIDDSGIEASSMNVCYDLTYRPVKPNSNYIWQGDKFISSYSPAVYFYDISKNFISRISSTSLITFTTPSNAYFIRLQIPNNIINAKPKNYADEWQIKQGTTPTPYEPYTESTQYFTAKDSNENIVELRSLPNGTKDEVSLSEGKLYKRISDVLVIDGNIGWGALITSDNTYRMRIVNWANSNNAATSSLAQAIDSNGTQYPNVSPVNDERLLIVHSDGALYVRIEKTKVDTMSGATIEEKFKTYLNQYPITLTYQLATPVEIPIEVSGTLMSYPSGTIYIEPVVADAGIYDNGISVLHQDLPIKELERVAKIDFMTGVETELDVSQAVIASDRLSFTHPNLNKDDIMAFNYFYDKEGTEGEMTVEFYDSRYVIQDSVLSNKFYQWKISVANGVPSIGLVEV